MKRIMNWLYAIAIAVFVIDWGYVGIKLLNGEYDVTVGAYIGLVCVSVMIVYYIYRIFGNKCPYCGKLIHLPGCSTVLIAERNWKNDLFFDTFSWYLL